MTTIHNLLKRDSDCGCSFIATRLMIRRRINITATPVIIDGIPATMLGVNELCTCSRLERQI